MGAEQPSRATGGVVGAEQLALGAELGAEQLQVVLLAVCSGVAQASRRYQLDPALIQSWIRTRELDLETRCWTWDTEPVAEWVLVQREQQVHTVLVHRTAGPYGPGPSPQNSWSTRSWSTEEQVHQKLYNLDQPSVTHWIQKSRFDCHHLGEVKPGCFVCHSIAFIIVTDE